MIFRADGKSCQMHHRTFAALMLFVGCTMATISDNNHCYDVYKHGCRKNFESSVTKYREVTSQRSCSVDDVGDDAIFTVLLAEDGSSSSGIAELNVTLPDADCNYGIALLVNSSITKREDCTKSVFHETNSYENEVHSVDRTICVLSSWNESSGSDCQNKTWSMWYEHVFTGCYALRFTVDGYEYSVRGNTYLVTDYRRTEVAEPKFRCHYEDRPDTELGTELMIFVLRISLLSNTAGMRLTLVPMSQQPNEANENACIPHNENSLHTWEIITDDGDSALKNCSQFGNDNKTKHMDCDLTIRVPRHSGYCFRINLLDGRCHRQTIWNPPPNSPAHGLLPCTWLQRCARIVKNVSAIEHNGTIRNGRKINSDLVLALPIVVTVILMTFVVTGSALYVYRSHSRRNVERVYANTNLRNLKTAMCDGDVDSVETTDDETTKGSRDGDERDAIVLLYARGSPSFMSLMTDLREIFKIHCGCHVRDWYAPNEWDNVATVGPSSWVGDLLRRKYRAIWIDTPRARTLLDVRERNERSNEPDRFYERCSIDDEAVSDFRDIALPSVLDLAKRNVNPDLALQYRKHFVVRLEGFDVAANRSNDPFEDLSPHTRYLIPYHLAELCSHISPWRRNLNTQSLKTVEAQLRERLVRMNQ